MGDPEFAVTRLNEEKLGQILVKEGIISEEDLTTTSTDELLMPRRFKDLIVTSSLIRLFPMALGDDADNEVAKLMRDFDRQEKALDIDIGSAPKRPTKKIKIRPMY